VFKLPTKARHELANAGPAGFEGSGSGRRLREADRLDPIWRRRVAGTSHALTESVADHKDG
jgi:hypothetical protein